MIKGIGVDIEEIKRFRKLKPKVLKRIIKRVLTRREIEYCYKFRDPYPHLVARFCAKEALLKALNLKNFKGLKWKDIEVVGKPPYMNVKGGVKEVLEKKGVKRIHLSLSHSKECAIAFVILED